MQCTSRFTKASPTTSVVTSVGRRLLNIRKNMLRFNNRDPSGRRGRNLCSGSSSGSRPCTKYRARGIVPPSSCDQGTELNIEEGTELNNEGDLPCKYTPSNAPCYPAKGRRIVRQVREYCVTESCIVMHCDANWATGAPLTN